MSGLLARRQAPFVGMKLSTPHHCQVTMHHYACILGFWVSYPLTSQVQAGRRRVRHVRDAGADGGIPGREALRAGPDGLNLQSFLLHQGHSGVQVASTPPFLLPSKKNLFQLSDFLYSLKRIFFFSDFHTNSKANFILPPFWTQFLQLFLPLPPSPFLSSHLPLSFFSPSLLLLLPLPSFFSLPAALLRSYLSLSGFISDHGLWAQTAWF